MDQNLNMELVKLQDELNLLDDAVKQIDNAGKIATGVAESTRDITLKLNTQIDAITAKVDEVMKQSAANTDTSVQALSTQYQKQIDEVNVLMVNYKGLADAVAKIQPQFEKLDFPARFDKVNQDISAINTTLAMTSKLMDNMETRQKAETANIQVLSNKVSSQNGQLKLLAFLLILIIAALVAGFGLQYFKVI